MNAFLARSLVRLHAGSWRRRYGVEYEALLLEVPLGTMAVASSVASAIESRGASIGPFAVAPLVLFAAMYLAAPLAPGELDRDAKAAAIRTAQHQSPLLARPHAISCYQAYFSPRKSLCA